MEPGEKIEKVYICDMLPFCGQTHCETFWGSDCILTVVGRTKHKCKEVNKSEVVDAK